MSISTQLAYLAETQKVDVYIYEWIDLLDFCRPIQVTDYAEWYDFILKQMYEAGWEGDGELSELWIPPFALGQLLAEPIDQGYNLFEHGTDGLIVWHVKQQSDGLSFIASIKPLHLPDIGLDDPDVDE